MARVRNRQAGFTLIEMMFVVAIIAVLAALAIPQFMSDSRKTKANAEVNAFFAALITAEEQYKVENGSYFQPVSTCPATTNTTGVAVTCANAGQPWAALNVKLPTTTAYCTYAITANSGTGTGNINVGGTVFNFTSPTGNWYHIVAQCDLDGDGTTTKFFTSSVDSTIQKSANEDD